MNSQYRLVGRRRSCLSPSSAIFSLFYLLSSPSTKGSILLTTASSVVIIHDLPTSNRPNTAFSKPPVLQRQTFAGEIMGKGSKDICGEVLACRASSREEVETQLQAHPFAKVSVVDALPHP